MSNTIFGSKQKGQATLEILLIGVIGLMIWSAMSTGLKKSGAFQTVFGDPWTRLINVVEFGVPSDKQNLGAIHPANPNRHSTRKRL